MKKRLLSTFLFRFIFIRICLLCFKVNVLYHRLSRIFCCQNKKENVRKNENGINISMNSNILMPCKYMYFVCFFSYVRNVLPCFEPDQSATFLVSFQNISVYVNCKVTSGKNKIYLIQTPHELHFQILL